jgi:hypothetical protein
VIREEHKSAVLGAVPTVNAETLRAMCVARAGRECGALPGVHAATEAVGVVSGAGECLGGAGAAMAALTDGDDGSVTGELLESARELGERHMGCLFDVASVPFGWLTDVDDDRVFGADEFGCGGRLD